MQLVLTVAKHLALAKVCSGEQFSGNKLKLLGVAEPNVALISGFLFKFLNKNKYLI